MIDAEHTKPTVHKLSERLIAAETVKSHGNGERVATALSDKVMWWGITIQSRYSKAHELEQMLAMAAAVDRPLRGKIAKIFCDSKSNSFEVTLLRSTPLHEVQWVGQQMEAVCSDVAGGHNGIWLDGGARHTCDPAWSDDLPG